MGPTIAIVSLWVAFAGTHMVLSSEGLRPRLVSALGERGFLGLYSLVAFATFVPLVWVYFANRHSGPFLWHWGGSIPLRYAMYAGMALAIALVISSGARPSPASIAGGRSEAAGVLRITRHPVFMGIGLFGLLHLLVAPVNTAELAFFGGFPIFALVGSAHQDRRKLAQGLPGYREFCEATPFLPLSRPGALLPALREDAIPIAAAIVLTIGLRVFHEQLFG